MPYSMPDDIPDYLKGLPEEAQAIFVEVFNQAISDGKTEDDARMAAWGAVKASYEKQGGKWVRKAAELMLRFVSEVGELKPSSTDKAISKVQVFRTGTFYHGVYGKFSITADVFSAMVNNFMARRPKAPTEMVVDFEHMSSGSQIAPAAGWVKALFVVADGLWATVEWTDKAADMIRNREYRYISPEWTMDYKDKDTGKSVGPCLLAIALTNRPFLEGMQPVVLSEALEAVLALSDRAPRLCDGLCAEKKAALDKAANAGVGPDQKKEGQEVSMEELEKKIREMMGLGETDDVMAAIKGMMDKMAEYETIVQEHEAEMAKEKKARETAETALKAAHGRLLAKEVEADVESALNGRRLLPKQVAWAKEFRAKDPESFKKFIETAPEIGPDGTVKGSEGDISAIQLSETELGIAIKMGVTRDQLLAQKQADLARK